MRIKQLIMKCIVYDEEIYKWRCFFMHLFNSGVHRIAVHLTRVSMIT